MFRQLLFAAIALCCVRPASSIQPGILFAAALESREDRIVNAYMTRYHVPGLAFAIMQDGNLVSHGEYGVANLKTGEKITTKSVFPIASLSKPFVALGVLSLAENGKLQLQDPVGKYVSGLPDDWKIFL